jgi:hypothetical protein
MKVEIINLIPWMLAKMKLYSYDIVAIKLWFFKSFYAWMAAYNSPHFF